MTDVSLTQTATQLRNCWCTLLINRSLDYFKNIIIPFFSVGDNTTRAILDFIIHSKISITIEQIKRTPAKKTWFPFLKIMAREKTALIVNKILIVHPLTPPARIYFVFDRSSGSGLPTYPPSHHDITHDSGLFLGFRSLHGCGAAGDFHSSSLISFLRLITTLYCSGQSSHNINYR